VAFVSGGAGKCSLPKGLSGKVKRINDDGIALIEFNGIGTLVRVSKERFRKLRTLFQCPSQFVYTEHHPALSL